MAGENVLKRRYQFLGLSEAPEKIRGGCIAMRGTIRRVALRGRQGMKELGMLRLPLSWEFP